MTHQPCRANSPLWSRVQQSIEAIVGVPFPLTATTQQALEWAIARIRPGEFDEWHQAVIVECMQLRRDHGTLTDTDVRRIAWKISKRYLREKRFASLDVDVPSTANAASEVEINDIVEWSTAMLKEHASDFDTLVLQRMLAEETRQQIATALSVSTATVDRSLRRIRLLLSELIDQFGDESIKSPTT